MARPFLWPRSPVRPKQFTYRVLVEVREARCEVLTVNADSEAEALKLAGMRRERSAEVHRVRRRKTTPVRVLLADPNPEFKPKPQEGSPT